eukprot:COSAG01_NODE_70609_length_258_cov_0.647799_1_plen_48_part_10
MVGATATDRCATCAICVFMAHVQSHHQNPVGRARVTIIGLQSVLMASA